MYTLTTINITILTIVATVRGHVENPNPYEGLGEYQPGPFSKQPYEGGNGSTTVNIVNSPSQETERKKGKLGEKGKRTLIGFFSGILGVSTALGASSLLYIYQSGVPIKKVREGLNKLGGALSAIRYSYEHSPAKLEKAAKLREAAKEAEKKDGKPDEGKTDEDKSKGDGPEARLAGLETGINQHEINKKNLKDLSDANVRGEITDEQLALIYENIAATSIAPSLSSVKEALNAGGSANTALKEAEASATTSTKPGPQTGEADGVTKNPSDSDPKGVPPSQPLSRNINSVYNNAIPLPAPTLDQPAGGVSAGAISPPLVPSAPNPIPQPSGQAPASGTPSAQGNLASTSAAGKPAS